MEIKFIRDEMWHLAWHLHAGLHDTYNLHRLTALRHGSIIYNQRKRLLTQQVTI